MKKSTPFKPTLTDKSDLLTTLTSSANFLYKSSLPKNMKASLFSRFVRLCFVEDDLFTGVEDTESLLTFSLSEFMEQIKVLETYNEKGLI